MQDRLVGSHIKRKTSGDEGERIKVEMSQDQEEYKRSVEELLQLGDGSVFDLEGSIVCI